MSHPTIAHDKENELPEDIENEDMEEAAKVLEEENDDNQPE